MLVLSRKIGSSILIGDDMRIDVLAVTYRPDGIGFEIEIIVSGKVFQRVMKNNEYIKINDDISVKLLGNRGVSGIFGIDAPKDVLILRNELLRKIRSNNSRAFDGEDKWRTSSMAAQA